MTACEHVRVTSSIPVSLPPDEAFTLFTASGERSWVDGWDPQFPSPPADETEPGTVFTTAHGPHGTTWVVVRREGRRLVAYSNVTPGERAALITVSLEPSAAGTTATVAYEMTALAARREPRGPVEFAADYTAHLEGWRDRITRRGCRRCPQVIPTEGSGADKPIIGAWRPIGRVGRRPGAAPRRAGRHRPAPALAPLGVPRARGAARRLRVPADPPPGSPVRGGGGRSRRGRGARRLAAPASGHRRPSRRGHPGRRDGAAAVAVHRTLTARLSAEGLASRAELSVKLSALGQALDEELAYENARAVCRTAAEAGIAMTLDMEDHTTTDFDPPHRLPAARRVPLDRPGDPGVAAPFRGRLPRARASGLPCPALQGRLPGIGGAGLAAPRRHPPRLPPLPADPPRGRRPPPGRDPRPALIDACHRLMAGTATPASPTSTRCSSASAATSRSVWPPPGRRSGSTSPSASAGTRT